MNEVTVILTSSGRWDLLRVTLESFFKYNTYPVAKFIVVDDGVEFFPYDLKSQYENIIWATSPINLRHNQIASLDFLWSNVETPYAFQMEDDWEFLRPGFIEASMSVLERKPDVLMVWLKALEPENVSPIEWTTKGYGIFKRLPNLWSWHRFNPSLKRKADYDLIAPFSKHTIFNREKPWKAEADISQVYHKLGFTAAILPDEYIRHIGDGRHVS